MTKKKKKGDRAVIQWETRMTDRQHTDFIGMHIMVKELEGTFGMLNEFPVENLQDDKRKVAWDEKAHNLPCWKQYLTT